MVDRADLEQASRLNQELRQVNLALTNLNAHGRIIQMTISGGPLDALAEAPPPVSVSTLDIAYPAAMVDAIKTALNGRISAINDALGKLGVTGVG